MTTGITAGEHMIIVTNICNNIAGHRKLDTERLHFNSLYLELPLAIVQTSDWRTGLFSCTHQTIIQDFFLYP